MKPSSRRIMTALAFVLLATALSSQRASAQSQIPNFPLGVAFSSPSSSNNMWWLGGDAPYGMYLPGQGSFWGFSDTFLNQNGGRQGASVVGNTIAIGQILNGNFTPTYFYGGSATKPTGFFPEPAVGTRFWIQKALYINNKLFVFLSVRYVPPGSTDTNGIYSGEFIARVNNPTAVPWNWQVDYLTLIFTNQAGLQCTLQPGVEAIPTTDGNNVVVYGYFVSSDGSSNKSVIITVTVDALMNTAANTAINANQVQYFANDGGVLSWKPGFGGLADTGGTDDYADTYLRSVSGMSIRYNSTLGMWQVVGINGISTQTSTPANSACVWYSTSAAGPFVRNNLVTNFPQAPGPNVPDPSLYCYTVREWLTDPSQPNDSEILFTYTYSSTNFNEILTNGSLYQEYSQTVANPGPNGGVPASNAMIRRPKLNRSTRTPDPLFGPNIPKLLTTPPGERKPTFPVGASSVSVDRAKLILNGK